MKLTAKFLYENQPHDWGWGTLSHSSRVWWYNYADKINKALALSTTNQDEQTDDSSGVPSHSSGIFATGSMYHLLENE